MKRRTRKRDPSPAKKPGQNPAGPAEHVAEPPAAVYGEAESQAVGANSVAAHAETESTEISFELQREIENFTNSFHVQRASGTPPAPGEFAASSAAANSPGAGGVPEALCTWKEFVKFSISLCSSMEISVLSVSACAATISIPRWRRNPKIWWFTAGRGKGRGNGGGFSRRTEEDPPQLHPPLHLHCPLLP